MRIGLVGCGPWGANILRDLLQLGSEVVVVARSPESIERARAGGAMEIVGSVADLTEVDGVVVATATSVHGDVVEAVLDRLDVPVYVEKPLALVGATARSIAERFPGRVFVMDKWRYHPGVEALRDLVRSGELGAVVGIRTTRVGWGNPHADVDGVWILAPHDLAIALEILGYLPAPRAAVGDVVGSELCGMVAILGEEPWVSFEVSVRSPARRREVALLCEGGAAVLPDGYADHILVGRGPEGSPAAPESRAIPTEWPLLRELRAFLAHVDGGPPPKSTAEDGAQMVEIIEELRDMAAPGVRQGA